MGFLLFDVKLSELRRLAVTVQTETKPQKVNVLAEAIRKGEMVPPMIVGELIGHGEELYLLSGRHRLEAYIQVLGEDGIVTVLRQTEPVHSSTVVSLNKSRRMSAFEVALNDLSDVIACGVDPAEWAEVVRYTNNKEVSALAAYQTETFRSEIAAYESSPLTVFKLVKALVKHFKRPIELSDARVLDFVLRNTDQPSWKSTRHMLERVLDTYL